MKDNKNIQLFVSALKKVSMVKTTKELVKLIPVFGPVLEEAVSVALDIKEEYDSLKMEEKLDALYEEAGKSDYATEDIIERVKQELRQTISQIATKTSVYMDGLILYTFEEEIDEEQRDVIERILKDDGTSEEEQALAEFIKTNNSDVPLEDCFMDDCCLIMNFDTSAGHNLRNDGEILEFISGLNYALGRVLAPLFREYIVF